MRLDKGKNIYIVYSACTALDVVRISYTSFWLRGDRQFWGCKSAKHAEMDKPADGDVYQERTGSSNRPWLIR